MGSTVIQGIGILVLAGLVMGTSPWPLKLMKKFQYEHFAFVSMLFALIIIPWTITLANCPEAITALKSIDKSILIKSNIFSMAWGIAQVLALLCFVKIGVSLTYGILVAIASSVGVITPMIIKASGQFANAPNLASKAGITVLIGVAVMVAGVYFASLSGFGRERAQKKTQQQDNKSEKFVVGLIMVIAAGILAPGWGFAFAYSQGPIIDAMKAHGAADYPASIAVWAVALMGAALINILYPTYLMTKNKSWNILGQNLGEIGLSLIYGILFFIPSALLGKGMIMLGVLGASVGVGVQQATQMLGGQGLGFISGEWKGIGGKSRKQIYIAIVLLIIATAIMAFGNSFVEK